MKRILFIFLIITISLFAYVPQIFLLQSANNLSLASGSSSLALFSQTQKRFLDYSVNLFLYGTQESVSPANLTFFSPYGENSALSFKLNNISILLDGNIDLYNFYVGYSKETGGFILELGGIGNIVKNQDYKSYGYGYGFSAGVTKSLNNIQFGMFYDSGSSLNWLQNGDFFILNSLPASFSSGIKYCVIREKKYIDLYFNIKYLFPWVRNSGTATRNYILYNSKFEISMAASYLIVTENDNLRLNAGIMILPDSQLGILGNYNMSSYIGMGIDYATVKISFPVVFHISYLQNVSDINLKNIKAGVSYEF